MAIKRNGLHSVVVFLVFSLLALAATSGNMLAQDEEMNVQEYAFPVEISVRPHYLAAFQRAIDNRPLGNFENYDLDAVLVSAGDGEENFMCELQFTESETQYGDPGWVCEVQLPPGYYNACVRLSPLGGQQVEVLRSVTTDRGGKAVVAVIIDALHGSQQYAIKEDGSIKKVALLHGGREIPEFSGRIKIPSDGDHAITPCEGLWGGGNPPEMRSTDGYLVEFTEAEKVADRRLKTDGNGNILKFDDDGNPVGTE
ncbi:hypothetical protein ACFL6Y_02960 [Elusimicrobiota bacterium]